jgi:hypothetical protein
VQQIPLPGNLTPEEFLERFSTATEVMRRYEVAIQAAVAAGDMERADAGRVEYEKRKPQYQRLRMIYGQMLAVKQNSGLSCIFFESHF